MTLVIYLIPDRMFPKPPLPDAPFPFAQTALGAAFGFRQLARKSRFELTPTGRKIVITLEQSPNTMQVIWQYHDRLYLKWMCLFDLSKSNA